MTWLDYVGLIVGGVVLLGIGGVFGFFGYAVLSNVEGVRQQAWQDGYKAGFAKANRNGGPVS